ncbi:uncharacterized protein OCT59_026614 [Rhizophagus irregularis]|uniref:uncharacterized protein n=1 Tax=Rhizophagus irregularis TaxID=588596 RepID=UPI00331CE66D|nr:hypothetical protein OCT59_026614 [Rhizophagus irregularis]
MLMHNENEYKVLLRSLIIGLVLIENNSDVFLEINKNVKRVLREFLDNLSNRRLDNEFFTELIFIEIFLKKMDMKIMECSNNERKILEEVRTEIRKLQALMSTNKLDKQAFEVLEEGLITNECNLFWKRNLIKGNYREEDTIYDFRNLMDELKIKLSQYENDDENDDNDAGNTGVAVNRNRKKTQVEMFDCIKKFIEDFSLNSDDERENFDDIDVPQLHNEEIERKKVLKECMSQIEGKASETTYMNIIQFGLVYFKYINEFGISDKADEVDGDERFRRELQSLRSERIKLRI